MFKVPTVIVQSDYPPNSHIIYQDHPKKLPNYNRRPCYPSKCLKILKHPFQRWLQRKIWPVWIVGDFGGSVIVVSSKFRGHFHQFYGLFKYTWNEIRSALELELGYNDVFQAAARRVHLGQKLFILIIPKESASDKSSARPILILQQNI